MKVYILGEIHPEIGLLFIIEQTKNLEALRSTLLYTEEKKVEKILERRIESIRKILLEFSKLTEANIKTMQKENADFYLVEGTEKKSLNQLLSISAEAEKKGDETLKRETRKLRMAYETYVKLWGRRYDTFEYKFPRKALSAIGLVPEKTLRLVEIVTGKERLESKLRRKISAIDPLKYKIREIPASVNIVKKIKSHKEKKIMILTGIKHVQAYQKILKAARYEVVNVTSTKTEKSKRLTEAMEKTESMFERKCLETDLKKVGVPRKEAEKLARNFKYIKKTMNLIEGE